MTKTCIATLFIAASAVLSNASQLPEFPFVFAQGSATMEVAPDKANISFNLITFDADSTRALDLVVQRSTDLLALVSSHGISNEDIVAHQIEKRAEREHKDYVDLGIIGYNITRRFSITLRDLSKFDALMKAITELNNIVDIHCAFDKEDRRTIEADLFAKACANATRDAEALAAGFNRPLGPVHAVSRTGFENLGEYFGMGSTSFGGVGGRATLESTRQEIFYVPSSITFHGYVSALFQLEAEK